PTLHRVRRRGREHRRRSNSVARPGVIAPNLRPHLRLANPWVVRAAFIFAIVAASVPALAADPPAQAPAPTAPAPAAPATATPVSAATKELLDRIGSGDAAAADALYKTAPKVVAELATFLARPHATAANDRR